MSLNSSLLTIVIPAYNEAESLSRLLEGLISFCKLKNWKISNSFTVILQPAPFCSLGFLLLAMKMELLGIKSGMR